MENKLYQRESNKELIREFSTQHISCEEFLAEYKSDYFICVLSVSCSWTLHESSRREVLEKQRAALQLAAGRAAVASARRLWFDGEESLLTQPEAIKCDCVLSDFALVSCPSPQLRGLRVVMASISDNELHQTTEIGNSKLNTSEGDIVNPPSMVFFPSIAHQKAELSSLKMEVEESSEDTSSSNMWQVYALGGFLIARWVWAKWKERTGRPSEA
ncbi:hypothetical protein HPP92_009761 [Vanilla planifolia]|uniref:Uncharacterized protein n=1 Tax=Vanilla planifolia TaxID=51239 RepID=A0A835RGU2_VANPL|nr:hypothetical protein HPP92_009761 [Vanilla planifolia]